MRVPNKHAQALGKLSKGKPKNYSKEELEKRKERLALHRSKRWAARKTLRPEFFRPPIPVESSQSNSATLSLQDKENAVAVNVDAGKHISDEEDERRNPWPNSNCNQG